MYQKILVTLENSATDEAILHHIERLAHLMKSELLLVHVADGWAARNYDALKLAESAEMQEDRGYLESVRQRLADEGLTVASKLLAGEPAAEIIRIAEESHVDLIAMSTHGHRFLSDLFYG